MLPAIVVPVVLSSNYGYHAWRATEHRSVHTECTNNTVVHVKTANVVL
jgi:hypothetical protein